jgi:hypothetical protein
MHVAQSAPQNQKGSAMKNKVGIRILVPQHVARNIWRNGGKGILNDNAYIWILIEHHGFRFGKERSQNAGVV